MQCKNKSFYLIIIISIHSTNLLPVILPVGGITEPIKEDAKLLGGSVLLVEGYRLLNSMST